MEDAELEKLEKQLKRRFDDEPFPIPANTLRILVEECLDMRSYGKLVTKEVKEFVQKIGVRVSE